MDDFADGFFEADCEFGFFCHVLLLLVIARLDSMYIFEEMSIITQRGDSGETDLMFGRRIGKSSQRCGALGAIDELNAALGMARVGDVEGKFVGILDRVQNLLFGLMGELACLPEDVPRYVEKGFAMIGNEDVEWITETARGIEAGGVKFTHWAVPGAEGSVFRASLDFARTVSRRAEREVLKLHEEGGEVSEVIRLFLNRVSDLMWILARSAG